MTCERRIERLSVFMDIEGMGIPESERKGGRQASVRKIKYLCSSTGEYENIHTRSLRPDTCFPGIRLNFIEIPLIAPEKFCSLILVQHFED